MLSKYPPYNRVMFAYDCHRTDTGEHCKVKAVNSYYAKQSAMRKFGIPKNTKRVGVTVKCAGKVS